MSILKDVNYKKYAIRNAKNIEHITKLTLGRENNDKKIKNLYG